VCKKCRAEHQISIKSKLLFSFSIAVLLFIFSLANLPFNLRIAVIIIVFLSVLFSFPYFANYKRNESSIKKGKKVKREPFFLSLESIYLTLFSLLTL
jgi:uncharacterized membrane protein YidH (DUF202 family)